MAPPVQRARPDVHPPWHFLVVGITWVALGFLGCFASIGISTLSTPYILRTLLVVVLLLVAYTVWFRVGRLLGFIDRGALASIRQSLDGMTGV